MDVRGPPGPGLPGVLFIMVVSDAGSEFLKWYRTGLDEKRIGLGGPDVPSVLRCLRPLLTKAKSGAFRNAVIRAENHVITIHQTGKGVLLVLADSSVNLAMLLVGARETANRIAGVLV